MEAMAVDHNVNVVAMEKGGRRYAMVCAWAANVAADKMVCAIGPQSATGRAIEAGDEVGFTNLAAGQMGIAFQVGNMEVHSDAADKLEGVEVRQEGGAIVVEGGRVQVVGRVVEVLHLPGCEEENVVYIDIVDAHAADVPALHISDLPKMR